MFESVYAVYRALQDERDAINFLIDNEDTFNIAIDPNKIFIHGPGIFPMVSVMDPNEWPGFITGMFGPLATIPEPAGGIARNASIPEVTRFLDSGDDMPALLFHGTCGKRVPFDLVKANRIYECGSTYAPRNYSVYGSNQLASILHGHTRFFPICGLTHQLEKLEEYLLFEETTSFMYDVICETVNPATPDILVPYSVDPGDISTKCEPSDLTYTFCDTATVMPPLDSLRIAGPVAFTTNLLIWPNPTEGQFQVQIPSIKVAGSAFSEEADMLYVIDISGKEILRRKVISGQTETISMPEHAAKGLYLVKSSRHSATIYFQ